MESSAKLSLPMWYKYACMDVMKLLYIVFWLQLCIEAIQEEGEVDNSVDVFTSEVEFDSAVATFKFENVSSDEWLVHCKPSEVC